MYASHSFIMNRIVIYAIFLCAVITNTQSYSASTEDLVLVDEYYTITNTTIDKITEQDDKLARDIMKSDKDNKVIVSILVYRDKTRRRAISQEITDIANKKADQAQGRYERSEWRNYWIDEVYAAQSNLFMDLCHSLIFDENCILASYLSNFFRNKDRTWIVIDMVLTKYISSVIARYDRYSFVKFKTSRKSQKKPFENMLRVWVREDREPIENSKIPLEAIKLNAEALKAEQDDGGWHENRCKLELILMKKSIKFARLVIQEFEKFYGGKPIEDIINENVQKNDLHEDLAYAYASLARYIKDKHKYIAFLLDKYSDGSDSWAAWMICIAVLHPQEWPKIDEIFKKDHKGDSLSKFILQKMTCDKVVAEAIAVIVDPKFKPTTFTEKSDDPAEPSTTPPS